MVARQQEQPWNPFAGAVGRYRVNVALAEAMAYEFERRRWFGQTRRLVAEAKGRARRAGAPPPGPEGRRRKNLSYGVVTQAAVFDGREKKRTNVQYPLVVEEERVLVPSPAVEKEKTWFTPVGARITFADRCGPEPLEAFLKSVVAARGTSFGGGSTSDNGQDNRWAEIAEAKARRQRYLRNYCPFQREEEEISAPAAPEKKMDDDDEDHQQQEVAPEKTSEEAEVVDHAAVKQQANCPGSEGGDDVTAVRDKQARLVRGTTEYYVMRQEFLESYQPARKRRTFRDKALRLRVFRRLLPRRKKALSCDRSPSVDIVALAAAAADGDEVV